MAKLRRGDVIVTAFPFAERSDMKVRPALLYAGPWNINGSGGLSVCWALMITSSRRMHWPGDVEIFDPGTVGLPKTSLVRTLKIVCVDMGSVIQAIGSLDAKTWRAVEKNVQSHLKKVR